MYVCMYVHTYPPPPMQRAAFAGLQGPTALESDKLDDLLSTSHFEPYLHAATTKLTKLTGPWGLAEQIWPVPGSRRSVRRCDIHSATRELQLESCLSCVS